MRKIVIFYENIYYQCFMFIFFNYLKIILFMLHFPGYNPVKPLNLKISQTLSEDNKSREHIYIFFLNGNLPRTL